MPRKFGDQARKKLEKERYDMAKSIKNTAKVDRQTEMANQKAREFLLKKISVGKISASQVKTQQRNLSSQWKNISSKSILKGKTDNEIRAMFPINGKLSVSDEKTIERITSEDFQRQRQSDLSSDTIDQFKDATAQTKQRATRVSERLKQKREATQIAAESKRIQEERQRIAAESKRMQEEQERQRIATEEAQRIATEAQKKAILAQQNAAKAASVAKIASGQQQTAARSGLAIDKFKDNVAKKAQAAAQAAAEAKIAAEKAQQATIAAQQATNKKQEIAAKIASAQQQTSMRSKVVSGKFKSNVIVNQNAQEIAFKNQQDAPNFQIKFYKRKRSKSNKQLSKRLKQVIRDIKTLVSI